MQDYEFMSHGGITMRWRRLGVSGLVVEGNRKGEKLCDLGEPVLILNYID